MNSQLLQQEPAAASLEEAHFRWVAWRRPAGLGTPAWHCSVSHKTLRRSPLQLLRSMPVSAICQTRCTPAASPPTALLRRVGKLLDQALEVGFPGEPVVSVEF